MKPICARAQRESERYWMIMACHKKAIVWRHKDSFVLSTDGLAEATIALSSMCHIHIHCGGTALHYSALPPLYTPDTTIHCTQIFCHSELAQKRLCANGAFRPFSSQRQQRRRQGSEWKWNEMHINPIASRHWCRLRWLARHCRCGFWDRAKSCPNKGNL